MPVIDVVHCLQSASAVHRTCSARFAVRPPFGASASAALVHNGLRARPRLARTALSRDLSADH
jgi:hypothetical protein